MEATVIRKILMFILIVSCTQSLCFAASDEAAKRAADRFLMGIKLIELSEGKQILAETAWFPQSKYPVFTDESTLYEAMFPTDNPKIMGYKRLIQAKAVSHARTPLIQKYLLISYKDMRTGMWKVLEFREAVDTESEARHACSHGNDGQCAYWSAMAGNLSQALMSEIKANEIEESMPETKRNETRAYRASRGTPQPEQYLETLRKILGNR